MNIDNKGNISDTWDYRVVRKTTEKGITSAGDGEWLSVQEVYYDDETGNPMAQTIDLQIEGDTISEIRKRLNGMINCLDDPVLDESDITPTLDDRYEAKGYTKEHTKEWLDSIDTIENRVLSLEMENADMRDRLTELGDELVEKGL